MENVTRLGKMEVFENFVAKLEQLDYTVDYGTLCGPEFGLPQERRRLVLVASRIGAISLPKGNRTRRSSRPSRRRSESSRTQARRVRPPPTFSTARRLTPINERMKASQPGGHGETG